MFLLSAPRQQLARLPLARASGSSRFGFLTAYASTSRRGRSIDWTKLWVCVGVGASLFGLIGLWRYAPRAPRCRRSRAPASAGSSAPGAAPTSAPGNLLGVVYASVVPAAIFGARFGLATEPDGTRRRRIDQRSRAWIFVRPALGFILVVMLGSRRSARSTSRSTTHGSRVRRRGQLQGDLHQTRLVNFDNWTNMFTSRLFFIGLVTGRARRPRRRDAERRTRQPFELGPSSLGPSSSGSSSCSCAVLRVDPGHDHQQPVVGHRGHVPGDRARARRRRARRPGQGRERRQVADLHADGDLASSAPGSSGASCTRPAIPAATDRHAERDLGLDRQEHDIDDGQGRSGSPSCACSPCSCLFLVKRGSTTSRAR